MGRKNLWPRPGDPEDPDSFPKTLGDITEKYLAKGLWLKRL